MMTGKDLYAQFNGIFTEAANLRTVTLKERLSPDEIEDFLDRMINLSRLSIRKTEEQLNRYKKEIIKLQSKKTEAIER